MRALFDGILAGYGIAIPVGAIAVLIINTALQKGFGSGFMAGAGAATADFLYASLAAFAGAALVSLLYPFAAALQLIGALFLIGLGCFGIFGTWRKRHIAIEESSDPEERGYIRTYGRFLLLTMLNPLTIIYFAALIIGRGQELAYSGEDQISFIIGAGIASLSWQTLLAALGATVGRVFSPRVRTMVSTFGYLIVIGFGLRIVLQMLGVISQKAASVG